jgi:hypothetical protein
MAPMRARPRSLGLAAVALAWVLPLGACTGDSEEPPEPDGDPQSVALELSLGPGADALSAEARDDLQNDVGAVLSTYVVDGFLGEYPRDDFVGALETFTSGVADRAAEDLDLITGAGFEGDPEKVVATQLSASISTFAPGGKAVGVTARVDFAFDVTEGGTTHEEARHGRLMLTSENGTWQIFGYSLAPGRRAEGG